MIYRNLGKSGLKISALSYGSWVTFKNQVDTKLAKDLMTTAFDAGINFFDNAEVYAGGRSEEIMGEALAQLKWGRDTYCVSSKVFWGGELPTQRGLSRKHVFDACHAALKRLKVDYLDLYFCHRPDLDTPIEETVWAMNDLIGQGKVLYWGTSEWNAQQLTEAHQVARQYQLIGPTMDQPQYNMFERENLEKELLPVFKNYGLGTTVWSPLASGLLTGKYNDGIPKDSRMNLEGFAWLKERLESPEGQQRLAKVKRLAQLASELETPLANLSLAWCLKNKNVSTVILGASKKEQLVQNLKTVDHLEKLSHPVMTQIEQILENRPEPAEQF